MFNPTFHFALQVLEKKRKSSLYLEWYHRRGMWTNCLLNLEI